MKIAWMGPNPKHSIFQGKLLYDKLVEAGWDMQWNEVDNTTTHIICTSISQHQVASAAQQNYNIPLITWVMDYCEDEDILPEWSSYKTHIRKANLVITICDKVRWDVINLTGRYHVELLYPCVDDELIGDSTLQKEDKIVVCSSMSSVNASITSC